MNNNRSFFLMGLVIGTLLLVSCVPASNLAITSLIDNPNIVVEGGSVQYLLEYKNRAQSESFQDTIVVLEYDQYLFYDGANPPPDQTDSRGRALTWELGTLGPGEEGQINIRFVVESVIPISVYELDVIGTIRGFSGEGVDVDVIRDEERETTLIEGHPTPTSAPTRTPRATSPPNDQGTEPSPAATPTPLPTPTATPLPPLMTAFIGKLELTSISVACSGGILVMGLIFISGLLARRASKRS